MEENQNQPGMVGALAQLAYGQQGGPLAAVPYFLDAMLPASSPENEIMAFGSGLSKPTRTGALAESLSSGLESQLEARTTRDKLRAQYMPLIMNAIVQSQQMALQGANAGRDWLKEINPKIDAQLASLRTGNKQPSYEETIRHLMRVANQWQLPDHILAAKMRAIPEDSGQLAEYLDRLAVANAGPDKLLPTLNQNAAGQTTAASPVRGTMKVLGEEAPQVQSKEGAAGEAKTNPTSDYVDWTKATRGNVKEYEEGLRSRADAYRAMIARMNEQAEFVRQFTPGRYTRMAGGIAAAVKDLGSRLPGIDKKTVEDLAQKLLNAPEGSEQAIAAQQLFEQLAQQETLAQLKTSLGEGQRMNMQEYANFSRNNLGQAMDPATFKSMRDFYYTQAADAINRYSAWGKYVDDPSVSRHSVTGFDSKYSSDEFNHLLSGKRSVFSVPGGQSPTFPGYPEKREAAPAAPAAQAQKAAPIAQQQTQKPQVDLSQYEPGAKVGPTGKVYVIEGGKPRLAKPKKEFEAETNRLNSMYPVTVNGGAR